MASVMDTEQMNISIKKIKMYKDQESINFESIDNQLININNNYTTKNSQCLEALQFEISNKLSTITKKHNTNIFVLNENLNKYINTKIKVENEFDEII